MQKINTSFYCRFVAKFSKNFNVNSYRSFQGMTTVYNVLETLLFFELRPLIGLRFGKSEYLQRIMELQNHINA